MPAPLIVIVLAHSPRAGSLWDEFPWLLGKSCGFWESRVSSSSFSSSVGRDPGLCVGRRLLLHSCWQPWPSLLYGEAAALGRHWELTPGQEPPLSRGRSTTAAPR